ncbi:exosortase U [Roseimaritima ulvae]|uniref:Transmembrane exosortase (Exosortase_EpsH) n=1 Tax=Roseimaritima ulvae TaxID=980254 RepID=A0A5B9QLI8_9BACT|nr:exosortase U [Roseimaritima ulvae]QEG38672.1 Transmembrane exosortase (Exosortase_EpsH) [Roseimaritima ulvae]
MSVESVTVETHKQLPIDVQRRPQSSTIGWVVGGLLLLAQAPLIIEHFCNMLLRPHYQFAVLLPVGVGLLIWRGLRPDSGEDAPPGEAEPLRFSPGHYLLWGPVLLVSLGILVTATVYRSPWLGMLAFLFTTLGLILFVGGLDLFRRLWPAWLLMWGALPLPQNLDVRLIARLRTIATDWSSAVLDEFGVMHLVNGNVIHLPGKSLFIADACTGIHSLFVLMAAALFVGLWLRRPVFHILLLMVSTSGIVLVENVSRICTVAIANGAGLDWTGGWRHTLLGLVLFAASLLFILSADSLLQVLHFFSPRNLVATFRRLRKLDRMGTEFSRTALKAAAASVDPSDSEPQPVPDVPTARWFRLAPFAMAFLALGAVQLTWMPTRAEQLGKQLKENPVNFPEFGAESLPQQWDGWRRVDYRVSTRIVEDPLGEHSQSWVYQKGTLQAEISLDYPYRSLHDLTSCYSGLGWQMVEREVVRSDDENVSTVDPYVVARMDKPLHGQGFLIYSHYDIAGKCDVELKEALSLGQLLQRRTDFGLPWFQIQLLDTNSVPFSAEEERQLSELFFQLRKEIVEMCLQSINKGNDNA